MKTNSDHLNGQGLHFSPEFVCLVFGHNMLDFEMPVIGDQVMNAWDDEQEMVLASQMCVDHCKRHHMIVERDIVCATNEINHHARQDEVEDKLWKKMKKLLTLLAMGAVVTFVLLFCGTPVHCAIPHMINYQGMLTQSDGTTPVADGTYDIAYDVTVTAPASVPTCLNDGSDACFLTDNTNVQVTDDLDATFGAGAITAIAGNLTAGTCTYNAGFDGLLDTDLFTGTDTLTPGQSCTVSMAMTVTVVATLGTLMFGDGGLARIYPWSQPMAVAETLHYTGHIHWFAVIWGSMGGVLAAFLGGRDVARRDVL